MCIPTELVSRCIKLDHWKPCNTKSRVYLINSTKTFIRTIPLQKLQFSKEISLDECYSGTTSDVNNIATIPNTLGESLQQNAAAWSSSGGTRRSDGRWWGKAPGKLRHWLIIIPSSPTWHVHHDLCNLDIPTSHHDAGCGYHCCFGWRKLHKLIIALPAKVCSFEYALSFQLVWGQDFAKFHKIIGQLLIQGIVICVISKHSWQLIEL